MQNIDALKKVFDREGTNEAGTTGKTKKGEKFDIFKVDYPWVEKCTDKREMRLAYEAIKEDGGFPDLARACLQRLKQLDPKFKTESDFNNYTQEDQRAADKDVLDFLSEMNKAD